jgi:hypothetical protein
MRKAIIFIFFKGINITRGKVKFNKVNIHFENAWEEKGSLQYVLYFRIYFILLKKNNTRSKSILKMNKSWYWIIIS